MHAVLGTHKQGSIPFFERLLPDFHTLIVSTEDQTNSADYMPCKRTLFDSSEGVTSLMESVHTPFINYRQVNLLSLVIFCFRQSPERSEADKQWGLCIFDDVIEYYGPVSKFFLKQFLLFFCRSLRRRTSSCLSPSTHKQHCFHRHFCPPSFRLRSFIRSTSYEQL